MERARLKTQALIWLRADLALWAKVVDADNPPGRGTARQTLQHWQKDADLTGLRNRDALATLPKEERETCEKLWADIAVLLRRMESKKQP
jgi:hypothetical protein